MNKSKRLIFKLAFAALGLLPNMATTALSDTTDYTKYVNPFVGNADNGHTFPGACRPFGMIQTSPVTGAVGWRYCSEYVYSDSLIWGFTQTHLNGTGCMDLGDILVMPASGNAHAHGTATALTILSSRSLLRRATTRCILPTLR